jgi:hypothetical protein
VGFGILCMVVPATSMGVVHLLLLHRRVAGSLSLVALRVVVSVVGGRQVPLSGPGGYRMSASTTRLCREFVVPASPASRYPFLSPQTVQGTSW